MQQPRVYIDLAPAQVLAASESAVEMSVGPSGLAEATVQFTLPAGDAYFQAVVCEGTNSYSTAGYRLCVVTPGHTGNAYNQSSPLGTNLHSVTDWSPELPFVDVFKSSRPWISADASNWQNGWTLDTNARGEVRSLLPGQFARTVLFSAGAPPGRYVCIYRGNGNIQYWGAAAKDIGASTQGRDVVDVGAQHSMAVLDITATDPADPIREIRFVPIACELTYSSQIFSRQFLDMVGTNSTLRFMDWGRTNETRLAHWADRPLLDDARWSTDAGVPIEVMILLANEVDADPWICLPHLADEDYVVHLAEMLRQRLDPSLVVYLEYSNEVWNGIFPQSQFAQQQGLALLLSANPFQAGLRFYAQRACKLLSTFSDEFGDSQRLVRVLATQDSNPWVGTTIMDWQAAYLCADVLAGAPYFGPTVGPSNGPQILAMTVDQLFDYIVMNELPLRQASMTANVQNARIRGLQYVAYEGGQHLIGAGGWQDNAALNRLLLAANRHPRMADVYRQHLASWRVAGGTLFVHYTDAASPSKWGYFGALEHRDQAAVDAPKFLELNCFQMLNPRWW